jgi:hypothetical protein
MKRAYQEFAEILHLQIICKLAYFQQCQIFHEILANEVFESIFAVIMKRWKTKLTAYHPTLVNLQLNEIPTTLVVGFTVLKMLDSKRPICMCT